MNDPRHSVRPGQKLRIAAQQINFLNGLMRTGGGFGSGALGGWTQGTNLILVRNTTGDTVVQGGVLEIVGIEHNPEDNETAERQFLEMPCVSGGTPSAGSKSVVILAEPIKAGRIGRAFAAGVAQAKINRSALRHAAVNCANGSTQLRSCEPDAGVATVVWSPQELGEQWAIVRLGVSDSFARWGRANGPWAKNSSKSVVQLDRNGNTLPNSSGDETTFSAFNAFADLSSAGPLKVAAVLVDERWMIVAAECSNASAV